MKRTEAHQIARVAAAKKDISLDRLTRNCISCGIFVKPGENGNYSHSWIMDRLKANDLVVAEKIVKHSTTI